MGVTADGTRGMDRGVTAEMRRGVGSGSNTPPVVHGRKSSRAGISSAQAGALLSGLLGWDVAPREVERIALGLAKDQRLEHALGELWSFEPHDVDVLAGELWIRKATWRLRRAREGNFDAWLEDAAGEWRLLRLPYVMEGFSGMRGRAGEEPTELACFEWPTGTWTGTLTKVKDRNGLPAYAYTRRDEGT